MEAATGERIVAFGRAGKSPENPFFRHFAGMFDDRRNVEWLRPQRFLNPQRVELWSGELPAWLCNRPKSATRANQCINPGGSRSKAALPRANAW
jgi:hypothetical protein